MVTLQHEKEQSADMLVVCSVNVSSSCACPACARVRGRALSRAHTAALTRALLYSSISFGDAMSCGCWITGALVIGAVVSLLSYLRLHPHTLPCRRLRLQPLLGLRTHGCMHACVRIFSIM